MTRGYTWDRWRVTDESRPYFMPLPDNWENHKHANVVPYDDFIKGQSFTQQEYSTIIFNARLEKAGYFTTKPKPKEKTKAVAITLNNGTFIKREKLEPEEKDLIEVETDDGQE